MVSSAQRGSYYRRRTKRWLESKGYHVAELEKLYGIFRKGEPPRWRKQDQFGADLLAVSARSVIFVQCKGASAARGNFPDARRKFAQFQFPPWTRQWVIAWPSRSRVPRIVNCGRDLNGKKASSEESRPIATCGSSYVFNTSPANGVTTWP